MWHSYRLKIPSINFANVDQLKVLGYNVIMSCFVLLEINYLYFWARIWVHKVSINFLLLTDMFSSFSASSVCDTMQWLFEEHFVAETAELNTAWNLRIFQPESCEHGRDHEFANGDPYKQLFQKNQNNQWITISLWLAVCVLFTT